MKVYLSLNREARTSKGNLDWQRKGYTIVGGNPFGEESGYLGSKFLAKTFIDRGHDLHIVHPSDLTERKEGVYAKKTYSFIGNQFRERSRDEPLFGDVFFVYGLEEEAGPVESKRFMDLLFRIDNGQFFGHVLNDAESTSYEYKPKQKSLRLPWPITFRVDSRKDLASLLENNEMIAKPSIGARSQGIVPLFRPEDVDSIPEGDTDKYVFESFIDASEERRYVFLDNQLILRRRALKRGLPGAETFEGIDLFEGIPGEIEIARKAVDMTGMFYCAVDFRGDFLLEINGSGTGVAPPTIGSEFDSYNLSSPIVRAVERRFEHGK